MSSRQEDLHFMPDVHAAVHRRGQGFAYILTIMTFLFVVVLFTWANYAVLDEVTLSLRDVLEWKVGSKLMLDCAPDGEIELRCEDFAMFTGRMGRSKGNIAVQITGDIVPLDTGAHQ